jgi:hypothetical protein
LSVLLEWMDHKGYERRFGYWLEARQEASLRVMKRNKQSLWSWGRNGKNEIIL